LLSALAGPPWRGRVGCEGGGVLWSGFGFIGLPAFEDGEIVMSTLVVTHVTLAQVRSKMTEVGRKVAEGETPLGKQVDAASVAAGEFTPKIRNHVTAFMLSWADVLRVSSQSAVVVAGNADKASTDAAAVDVSAGL
jgi:hypothetical protein